MNKIIKSIIYVLYIGELFGQSKDITNKNKYYHQYIDINNLKILSLTVNESTFDDIVTKLGRSNIIRDGHEEIICYCSNKENDPTKIVFYRNDISDFVGFKITTDTIKYNSCNKTDSISINTIIKSGLKLDLTQKEVLSVLGEPTLRLKNNWKYSYWIQEKIKNNMFDVCSTISIKFKNDKTISIDVFKTVTN